MTLNTQSSPSEASARAFNKSTRLATVTFEICTTSPGIDPSTVLNQIRSESNTAGLVWTQLVQSEPETVGRVLHGYPGIPKENRGRAAAVIAAIQIAGQSARSSAAEAHEAGVKTVDCLIAELRRVAFDRRHVASILTRRPEKIAAHVREIALRTPHTRS